LQLQFREIISLQPNDRKRKGGREQGKKGRKRWEPSFALPPRVGSSMATFPVTSFSTRRPSYLSPRSAASLTARSLNSLDDSWPSATWHCLSCYTREVRRVGRVQLLVDNG